MAEQNGEGPGNGSTTTAATTIGGPGHIGPSRWSRFWVGCDLLFIGVCGASAAIVFPVWNKIQTGSASPDARYDWGTLSAFGVAWLLGVYFACKEGKGASSYKRLYTAVGFPGLFVSLTLGSRLFN